MKKLLLSGLFLASGLAQAQLLDSEDFNSMTIGNVGTDITGATEGQNAWITSVSGGSNTDFMIVANDATHQNVLQITGSATATGTRFMWHDGLPDQWTFRDAGNDILQVEFDLFTGPVTTSKNTHRVMLFNADRSKFLGGLMFAADTKIISGLSYYNNAGTLGNYSFNPTSGAVTLAANTWVRMGFSFNLTTGVVICKAPGLNMTIPGAAAGEAPDELNILVAAGTGNTVSSVALFDNYNVTASATDTLLANDVFMPVTSNDFKIYPIPANNNIMVSNSANVEINQIQVSDINGRIIKDIKVKNTSEANIDISNLNSGVYLIKVISTEGAMIRKIIKN
ncbi:T9SS type A sorting domain-containing protein [Flavobacterium sp. CYK-55]|uniref:T9SS type A sorting domain-containing protein n=1 Tax=Flavobacterium sp. CYK-55 TaxID=2835529 RepID=UPI001BCF2A3A|nr:T9SS type A sorting domain-containing protein [Flavobacterium sp. CYK-55]MBS7786820.1 T9SS type A sorting domain-containing protein [Flavobacterium sp. CYK-55]